MSQPVDPLTACRGYRCDWENSPLRLCPLHAQAPALREALAELVSVVQQWDAGHVGPASPVRDARGSKAMFEARALLKEIEP